ncbi:Porphobilinogen synthase [Methanolacinia petrolearia DSM 11571]|uniref:Delta-aminolevulinic acid dehydratase n=1 Tax=Methanolacinia petrolearia (strain DSM 11571 / OCM 486 / SEBR 4847) TaxID=679926 RepID=E1RG50_METP4|nr:porphobilinogen synthase [Methanolacinia petrolearia]ADN36285.1 Porphobilinogen synthase [Methanolacinia petrolearia DSM 11571]
MYPQRRLRRLRKRNIQPLFRETTVLKEDLVMPVFFDENIAKKKPIESMPGQYRYPLYEAGDIAQRILDKGIQAMLIFGIPGSKDEEATEAWNENGVVQEAVRMIKSEVPEMVVITDVCACEYTSHGHCGIVGDTPCGPDLLNDPSLELMMRIAVSHAEAGADMVAPSCMLDGQVTAIREALDEEGFDDTPIMSYSTKFASALYGPFREAADSGMAFGDRTTYQMEPGNAREAFLESELDLSEGADILMVKPAGFYHDIIASVTSLGVPVAAYQVSGEYSMIKAASEKGWLDEKRVVMESVKSIKRAGADLIITYFAEDIAGWIDEEQ